jgi:hypothetical protein
VPTLGNDLNQSFTQKMSKLENIYEFVEHDYTDKVYQLAKERMKNSVKYVQNLYFSLSCNHSLLRQQMAKLGILEADTKDDVELLGLESLTINTWVDEITTTKAMPMNKVQFKGGVNEKDTKGYDECFKNSQKVHKEVMEKYRKEPQSLKIENLAKFKTVFNKPDGKNLIQTQIGLVSFRLYDLIRLYHKNNLKKK